MKVMKKEIKTIREPPEAINLESLEAKMAWLDARDEERIKTRKEKRKTRK
jgi:hypothetical protein